MRNFGLDRLGVELETPSIGGRDMLVMSKLANITLNCALSGTESRGVHSSSSFHTYLIGTGHIGENSYLIWFPDRTKTAVSLTT